MLHYMAEHAKTQLEGSLRNKVFGNMLLTYRLYQTVYCIR